MIATIQEKERGFLFKNGRFVRMLEPGRHTFLPFMGYSAEVVEVDDESITDERLIATYSKDKNFLGNVTRVDVPDNHIALHYIDEC